MELREYNESIATWPGGGSAAARIFFASRNNNKFVAIQVSNQTI